MRTIKDEWLQIPMMSIRFKLSDLKFDTTKEFKDLHRAVMKVLGRNHKFTAVIKVNKIPTFLKIRVGCILTYLLIFQEYEPILGLELYWDNECQESVFTQMFEKGALEVLNSSLD